MNEAADDDDMLTVLISSLSATTEDEALNPPHTAFSSHACLRPLQSLSLLSLRVSGEQDSQE